MQSKFINVTWVDELNVGFSASQKGTFLIQINGIDYAMDRETTLYLAHALLETMQEADKQFSTVERILTDAQVKE